MNSVFKVVASGNQLKKVGAIPSKMIIFDANKKQTTILLTSVSY